MEQELPPRTGDRAPRRLRALDPRPPVWAAAALAERDCPLCGGGGPATFVRPDGLSVRACGTCGTCYVSPAPSEADVLAFYRLYHDRHRVDAWRDTPWHAKSRLPTCRDRAALAAHVRRGRPLDDLRLQELASLVDLAGARVLDVGCGIGTMLARLARLGAAVRAVDPDGAAVEFVAETLGIAGVELGTLESLREPDGSFDVVLLQDVLEHVVAPRAMLERAVVLLRPGGILYLFTPNATFVEREEDPLLFRIDYEHLQFLRSRTVVRLAAELDLELLHLESFGYLSLTDDPPRNGRLSARAALARLPGFAALNRLRLALEGRHQPRAGNYHLFALLAKR